MRCSSPRGALLAVAGIGGALVALTGCSNNSATNLVGTWVGDYSFALANGTTQTSTETLVITKHEGPLLWGYEQWDENGTQMRADLTGSLTDDGQHLTLTEPAGFFAGTISGETMTVVFTRIDETKHTAFEVTLTRR